VLIRGGRIVTARDDYVADVFVADETVSLVGASLDVRADRVIDAAGKYVLPGGVDPHAHLDTPGANFEATTCDDFTSGTVASAFGGTTTQVDFCFQLPGRSLTGALDEWHAKLERCPPVIDVGFHIAVTDLKEHGSLAELERLPADGVTSFKLFLAYKGGMMVDDETLFRTLEVGSRTGALVMIHAENGDAIEVLRERAIAEGKTEPRWHAATRPPVMEGEATHRAIQLAHAVDCPVYIVHVTCAEAIEPIARAKAADRRVWGETCTQYLFIDETMLEGPGFDGAKYVFTPPPRPKEHQEHLWHALRSGVLTVVATDHAPFTLEQKALGRNDFRIIPNGGPGSEDRLRMLHNFGVRGGRLTLNQLVDLTSTEPARLFGLYPRKGTIAIGSDADLVVFDPNKRQLISADDPRVHHSKSDYNLYEGTEVVGAPEIVLVRGTVVVENDELVAPAGHGSFIKRALFREQLAARAY
jgi:dihydropyrimidinase